MDCDVLYVEQMKRKLKIKRTH